jgi:prolipoprotein diacylglyceryl transferase
VTESGYILWNWDPEFLSLGPITIRYYGVMFMLAFLVGYALMKSIYRREEKPEPDLDVLLTTMMIGTVAGARLGHCLFYDPAYYLSNPLRILKVWEGGLASHGAAIGIFAALYHFSRKRPDQPYLWLLDRTVITVALAGFFIRLGNFFNSEILGLPADVPWAVVFLRHDALPRHPAQLYESLAYAMVFLGLYRVYRKLGARTPPGFLLGLFLVAVFVFRFFIEFVKERQAAYEAALPLSVGQILSIPLVFLGIYFLVRAFPRLRPPSP